MSFSKGHYTTVGFSRKQRQLAVTEAARKGGGGPILTDAHRRPRRRSVNTWDLAERKYLNPDRYPVPKNRQRWEKKRAQRHRKVRALRTLETAENIASLYEPNIYEFDD
jgi:hypothetical protein